MFPSCHAHYLPFWRYISILAKRIVLAFIMACGYISDLCAADKGKDMDKVKKDFTRNEHENSLDS